MKSVEQALREAVYSRHDTGARTTDIYVVVDPADGEPEAERVILTEEQLAHSGNRTVVKDTLEHLTLSAIEKWRGA